MDRNSYKVDIKTRDPGYESFPVSIMNRSTYEVVTFDPFLGESARISYSLNKSGCIRIRLVHRDTPSLLIRTLQDWTNQDFGKYELKWDGRDTAGNIVDNKKMFVLFEAKDKGKTRQHQEHDEGVCKDPLIKVATEPDSAEKGIGTLELRMSFSEVAPGFEDESGFKVRYFIDYKLWKTERVDKGMREFIFRVDTSSLDNGEHLITVNVDDFLDHIGSAGVKIRVGN